MGKINDGRIGNLDKKGMIEKYPTHYATGGFWNRTANATPSTCYFGKDGDYFFVLPIKVPTISEQLWDEFYQLIEQERPVVEAPQKKEPVVIEDSDVIKGDNAFSPAIIKPKTKKTRIDPVEDEETSRPEDDFPGEPTDTYFKEDNA